MTINCEIRVFVCASTDKVRRDWVNKIADEFLYATTWEAVGRTREWGEEQTTIVSCLYDNETREWGWYDDILPELIEYKIQAEQDVLAVYVDAHGKFELHLVSTDEDWYALSAHVCIGL